MLSKAIMAPRDLLLDTAKVQRLALFFEHILIWKLDRGELSREDAERLNSDVEYLRSQKLVMQCGYEVPPIISFGLEDGGSWSPFDVTSKNCDLLFPTDLVWNIPKKVSSEAEADHVVRHLSSYLVYDGAPVLAHIEPSNISQAGMSPTAIEIVLKNVPVPPENMPWDDFLQFRKEEENIAKLRALRLWMRKQATSPEDLKVLQEELESLLYDYQKYMDIQHRKYGCGVVSTLIAATPEVISHLMQLNIGSALKAVLDMRAHGIALTEAEMSAPGREVSYIARARKFVSGG